MAACSVDGALLQKPIAEMNDGIRTIRNELLGRVLKAAENNDRVFVIMSVFSFGFPSRFSWADVLNPFVGTTFLESRLRRSGRSCWIAAFSKPQIT